MEERRSVGKILRKLRESTEESGAIEVDILAKTAILRSKHKAFKKTPDWPLGEVVRRKLAKREKSQSRKKDTTPPYPSIWSADRFDMAYIPALHKRIIRLQIRIRVGGKGWGSNARRSRLARRSVLICTLDMI